MLISGFIPLEQLVEAVSIGTLIVFIIVAIALIKLRITRPDLQREFSVPFYPVTPLISIAACCVILWGIKLNTWLIFGSWIVIVMIFYITWSRKHSQLGNPINQ